MEHRLIVLGTRTFLVPKNKVPQAPTPESLQTWEVSADEALAWQRAQLNAALQKVGALTGSLERALAGGSAEDLGLPVDTGRAQEDARRATLALKAKGGGKAVLGRWAGPGADRLADAISKAMTELDKGQG